MRSSRLLIYPQMWNVYFNQAKKLVSNVLMYRKITQKCSFVLLQIHSTTRRRAPGTGESIVWFPAQYLKIIISERPKLVPCKKAQYAKYACKCSHFKFSEYFNSKLLIKFKLNKLKFGSALKTAFFLNDRDRWCNKCFVQQYFHVLITHTVSRALRCFFLHQLTKNPFIHCKSVNSLRV